MIFGIGLGRTGTRSLTDALRLMGFNAVHWDDRGSHVMDRWHESDLALPAGLDAFIEGRLGHVLDFRIDAGYTDGATLDLLTDEKLRFIGRLKSNAVLERLAAPHLWRPVGRPPQGGYEEVVELGMYQAASWKHPQRLLLVIVDRPDPKTGQLNLLPDYFFLVVGWQAEELDGPAALEHYRQRGTFEDRLGEFQQAIAAHLSHDDFQANEALLRLSLLAFNLGSMLRIEYEAAAGSCFDLGRFQRDVLKAGGRVVKGGNRLLLRVARVVAPFWEQLAGCLARWKLPARFSPPRARGSEPGDRLPGTPFHTRCDAANDANTSPATSRFQAKQTTGVRGRSAPNRLPHRQLIPPNRSVNNRRAG